MDPPPLIKCLKVTLVKTQWHVYKVIIGTLPLTGENGIPHKGLTVYISISILCHAGSVMRGPCRRASNIRGQRSFIEGLVLKVSFVPFSIMMQVLCVQWLSGDQRMWKNVKIYSSATPKIRNTCKARAWAAVNQQCWFTPAENLVHTVCPDGDYNLLPWHQWDCNCVMSVTPTCCSNRSNKE